MNMVELWKLFWDLVFQVPVLVLVVVLVYFGLKTVRALFETVVEFELFEDRKQD